MLIDFVMSNSTVRRHQTEAEKNINRLRNVMPDKYMELCIMHLSFLLDLDGCKLEELGETEVKQETKKKGCSTPFSKKKEKTLFGSPITQGNIAQIYQLIEFLGRPENIRKEGIFRKCGNCNRQRLLKECLVQGAGNLGLDDGTFSAHDAAVVLKYYLQDLPEPLLTDKQFECYRQILDMGKFLRTDKEKLMAKEKQLKAIQVLILMLPRENALLLECILDLLHRVSNVSENMMTANSLGTIFAPHLLCSRKMTALELHAVSGFCTEITTVMIENSPKLFKIPRELAIDVSNFWTEMEDPTQSIKYSERQENFMKSKQKNNSGPALNTVICYNDRQGQPTPESDTKVALAGLYAHVQAMPESAKKKKLMKQFQRANRPSTPKSNKHSRSKTFGESLKKHFPVLHKHKRNDSNGLHCITSGLAWAVTKPITIEETGNDKVTIISCGTTTTPCNPSTPRTNPRKVGPKSPAVHIVDMWQSPVAKSSRKRSSNESDENIPKKESKRSPVSERLPVAEKEIRFLSRDAPIKKILVFTPDHSKPVALVSPITKSVSYASHECQKSMLTPRSRKPMQLIQSPPERESSI